MFIIEFALDSGFNKTGKRTESNIIVLNEEFCLTNFKYIGDEHKNIINSILVRHTSELNIE